MIQLICTFEPARIDRLPQFVAHYRALGVERFLLSLQTEPELPEDARRGSLDRFEEALAGLGIPEAYALVEPFSAMALRRHHDALQARHVRPSDWIVWCDSDEFQVYPMGLSDHARDLKARGVDFMLGWLIDRLAEDWGLPPFDPGQPIWETFPRTCLIPPSLGAGEERRKVAFARGDLAVSGGNHRPASEGAYSTLLEWVQVHHFKWDATVIERLAYRLRPAFRAQCPWWVESERMLDYLRARGRRFDPADVEEIRLPSRELITP